MITIRKVYPLDFDSLLSISSKTFYNAFEHLTNPDDFEAYTSKAFTREQLLSEINNADSEFNFALLEDEPVGYIKLNYRDAQAEFQDTDAVEVSRIYVLASQQGKKIGNQLGIHARLPWPVGKTKARNGGHHNVKACRCQQGNDLQEPDKTIRIAMCQQDRGCPAPLPLMMDEMNAKAADIRPEMRESIQVILLLIPVKAMSPMGTKLV